jgi:hydrogenase nickel incorporation protein HypA/HybF
MHELSVSENILDIALRHAERVNAIKIKDLYLVIGDLSSIIDDSVQFYWDIITKNTIAEESTLHFKRIQIVLECKNCKQDYQPNGKDLLCPSCGGSQINIISGNEFYLESINVE